MNTDNLKFDNLSYGSHFKDNTGRKFIKVNLGVSKDEKFWYYGKHDWDKNLFNAIDYQGIPINFPFDQEVFPVVDMDKKSPNQLLNEILNNYSTDEIISELNKDRWKIFQQQPSALDNPKNDDIITPQSVLIKTNETIKENNDMNNSNNSLQTNSSVTSPLQLTIREAVIWVIDELTFPTKISIYQITSKIRDGVNNNEIAIPTLSTGNNGKIKYWIKHEDVRNEVEAMLNDGTFDSLGLSNIDFNGNFRLFEFSSIIGNNSIPKKSLTTSTVPIAIGTAPLVVDNNVVTNRVKNYLENRSLLYPVTLKEIQSAVKVNGVTCKDFASIVTNLGYTVTVTPGNTIGHFSNYTVTGKK